MNKLFFLTAIVFCLTSSCSNPNQADNTINQNVITNDSVKNNKTKSMVTQKITPYLWVDKDAKAVADYYLSIFKDGKLKDFRKFDSDESGNDAGIETAVIEIAGMEFSILAAGPLFKFNEAVSTIIETAFFFVKYKNKATYSLDCLLHNHMFSARDSYKDCKFIYLIDEPKRVKK